MANNKSFDARAEKFQLEEDKANQQKEIDDFIYQHSLDSQLSALDKEWERYSQLKDDEKELLDKQIEDYDEAHQFKIEQLEAEDERKQLAHDNEIERMEAESEAEQVRFDNEIKNIELANEAYQNLINNQIAGYERDKEAYDLSIEGKQTQIQSLNDSIANSGELTIMAMNRIDERGDALFGDLTQWNAIYGTGISEDITGAWQAYLDVVDRGNNSTLQNTLSLMQQIRETSKEIASTQANISSFDSSSYSSPSLSSPSSESIVQLRSALESIGYNVGWDDNSRSFTASGRGSGDTKKFSASGYENRNGTLYATEEQWNDLISKLPHYDKGGYIDKTQVALLHGGERVLNSAETKAYDTSNWVRIDPAEYTKGFFTNSSYNVAERLTQQMADSYTKKLDDLAKLVNNQQSTVIDSHDTYNVDGVTDESFGVSWHEAVVSCFKLI